jgi:hypothetical protein
MRVDNLGQAVRTQLIDGLSTDSLQDEIFACVSGLNSNVQTSKSLIIECVRF